MSNSLRIKNSLTDWHPANIQAALKKKGWSFRKLSLSKGYNQHMLKAVNDHAWPKGERIVADAIGVEPWDIWPSRYASRSGEYKPILYPKADSRIKCSKGINSNASR